MQGIGGGGVAGARVPVDDRRALRHGVHQMGTSLDGREAVREDGDRWEGHAVDLRGVEDCILPQHEALLRFTRLGILVVINPPEHHRDAVCACAHAPPGGFDLVKGGPEGRRKAHRCEEPHINTAIGVLAEKVAGHAPRAVPRLLPGDGALLQ